MATTMLGLMSLLLMSLTGPNLLVNPGFDKGLDGWQKSGKRATIESVKINGRSAVHIVVPEGGKARGGSLYQEVAVKPGDRVTITGEGMRQNVKDGEGAFLQLAFINSRGDTVHGVPSDHVIADGRWTSLAMPMHLLRIVPEGCVKARVSLEFKGHGEAWFDNLSLMRLNPPVAESPAKPVTLEATGNIVCDSLVGFGAEDDGWFYYEKNMEHGVTPEDLALRESRIQWLSPDWVRSFMWIREWCPSGDLKTFSFDNPNMASHYRTFDLYQKIGASVNVTDVEWGLPGIYNNPELVAPAIGQMMEHLIKTKGYTCIKYWTLTNEPDLDFTWRGGYPFENYVRIYQLVREEFKKRGLNIKIVGSDDANSLSYFQTCLRDDRLFEAVDLFSSHTYPSANFLDAVPVFFDNRMELVKTRSPRKPFVVGELGFSGAGFGSHGNPLMKTYDYAMYAADFVIEGLNRGVAGFSMWAVQESYYASGDLMEPGLWDFKNNGWKPRPIYHAWGTFSRLTKTGDKVREVKSSSPARVAGSVVGDTLFWVNKGNEPAEVTVKGMEAGEARIMEEKTLQGDRECGVVEKLKDGRFTAPPRSFGTVK